MTEKDIVKIEEEIVTDQVRSIIVDNRLNEFFHNWEKGLYAFYYVENDGIYKKNSKKYEHVKKLRNWFKIGNQKEDPVLNINNANGYIKYLFYRDVKSAVGTIKSCFLLNGDANKKQLHLLETEYPSSCRTVSDIMNKNREYLREETDINKNEHFKNISCAKINFENAMEYEKLEVDLKTNGPNKHKKRTIYSFIVVENRQVKWKKKASNNSDSTKERKCVIEKFYDSLMDAKPNDFHYYINSFFEKIGDDRKYPPFNSFFLFKINFYINNEDEEKGSVYSTSPTVYSSSDIEDSPQYEYVNPSSPDLYESSDMENSPHLENINNPLELITNDSNNDYMDEDSNHDTSPSTYISNDYQVRKNGTVYINGLIKVGTLKYEDGDVYIYNKNTHLVGLCSKFQSLCINNIILDMLKLNENLYYIVENQTIVGSLTINENEVAINLELFYNSFLLNMLSVEEVEDVKTLLNQLSGLFYQNNHDHHQQHFSTLDEIQQQQQQLPPPHFQYQSFNPIENENPAEVNMALNNNNMNMNNIQLFNYVNCL
ncbi:hypothetical protein PIROE2DRAFT_15143 [Piromyces sp. E2]|nr:hypothetical protein PIROE2DRAFT_15143 [Piromyces sp. E2]|eukprot:OUM59344.1 hypothetical protein PIROE2DRAFT_15143 [Piromyces sp. E2]